MRETLEVAFEGSRVSVMPLVARGIVSLPGVTGFDGLGVAYMMPEPVHDIVGGTIGYLIAPSSAAVPAGRSGVSV